MVLLNSAKRVLQWAKSQYVLAAFTEARQGMTGRIQWMRCWPGRRPKRSRHARESRETVDNCYDLFLRKSYPRRRHRSWGSLPINLMAIMIAVSLLIILLLEVLSLL